MENINLNLQIKEKIYLKDPVTTELGRKILSNSITLIDELGLEIFSFRKLALRISSTESSIYRYFENKHYLFIYLINWYWEWTATRIDLAVMVVDDPLKKLELIIKTVIKASFMSTHTPYINEEVLHQIIVREGTKAYHHKFVDSENAEGFFLSYKALCKKISEVFLEINPAYPYAKSLASTLIEVCNNNIYFAKHLPRLTDLNVDQDAAQMKMDLYDMLYHMIISCLQNKAIVKPAHANGKHIL